MADIHGTADADLLFGAAMADVISGGEGRDVLYGGAGDDILLGGDGDDVLRGESGDDRLEGGGGNDDISSVKQEGSDTLLGGDGNDSLFVDRTRSGDTLVVDGGSGNDRLIIQLTAQTGLTAFAGEGDDLVDIFAIRNSFTLSLGAGRDFINLYNFSSNFRSGGQIVISDFETGATGDRINFSSLNYFEFNGWSPSTNPFAAGYLKAVQSGSNVVISARTTVSGIYYDAIVLSNVQLSSLTPENLGGWTFDGSLVPPVLLVGTGSGELIRGHGGADDIDGQDGDDILEGHAGADLIRGGEGNDIIRGGAGDDTIYGGNGNNSLNAGGDSDSLYGEEGNDTLTLSEPTLASSSLFGSGGSGHDSISVSGGGVSTRFTVDAGSGDDLVTVTGALGAVAITLGDGRDRVDIDAYNKGANSGTKIEISDFQTGDGGDRLIWTNFVRNSLTALSGPDPFASGHMRLLQSGADVLLQIDRDGGGDLFVTLITFRNSDAAAFTAYNLGGFAPGGAPVAGATISGTADQDRLLGTDGDDFIEGGDERDQLFGFNGDDILHGGAGNDTLVGYDGDDVLQGDGGNDTFNPGHGNDLMNGGDGNDYYDDTNSMGVVTTGSKGFVGGAGNDTLYWSRSSGQDILVASGDEDADYFSVRTGASGASFALDGGAGNDLFDVSGTGTVTLGEGFDHLRFEPGGGGLGVDMQDFVAGDLGDRMSFGSMFAWFTVQQPGIPTPFSLDSSENPFLTGHLKLVSSGSDTLLMVDNDGPSGTGTTTTFAILRGVDKYSLTSHNIGGYALPFTIGTAADETFQGGAGPDDFNGGGGNDTFLIGYGGEDKAVGGTGNDLFFVATGVYGPDPRSVSIAGGGGSDILQLQSKLSDYQVTLRPSGAPSYGAIDATGIGTVQFLSGYDSSRGWAAGSAIRYYITIEDGFAAAGAPLVLDSTRLQAGEGLTMHAGDIKDPDVFLRLIGGAGIDHVHAGPGGSHFDGAGGDDEFYTGLGDDTIYGGDGSDYIFEDVGYARSGTDYLDGGAGNDVLSLVGGPNTHWTSVTIKGGADTDVLFVDVQGAVEPGVAEIDLGTGNDRIQLRAANGTFNVTLGAGNDTVEISTGNFGGIGHVAGPGHVVNVADFDPTADSLSWTTALNAYLANGYSAGQSPFRTGHAQLIQDGADVLLQVSRLADGNFLTLLRFQNRQVSDFDGGLGGYATRSIEGTAGDDVLTGTTASDFAYGYAGNDLFRFDQAGVDYAEGREGDDTAYFANNFTAADVFSGGAGTDELVLQGGGAGVLTGITGVERITLLAASDARFGVTGLTGFGFNLTAAESNLLTGDLLTVDGSGLSATEKLTFNGSAETGGRFILIGGAGADLLTGGAGADVLYGGTNADAMTGGAGDDIFYVDNAGDTVSDSSGLDEIRTSLATHSIATAATIERLTGLLDTGQTLTGNSSDNILRAGGGNDVLSGGVGLDVLWGGAGHDSLDGGTGADTLRGEQGNDAYVVDNGADVVIEGADEGSDTVYTNLLYYTLTANVERLTGTSTGTQELRGNASSNVIITGAGSDFILLQDGGDDFASGGEGTDTFFFGAALDGSDQAHGGGGFNSITLQGTYIGLTLSPANFSGIEGLIVLGRSHLRYGGNGATPNIYDVSLGDDFIASGAQFHVDATTLAANETLTFNGSAELDGSFVIGGGAGNDILTGGAGNNSLNGWGGADTLTGGLGNDIYTVDNAGDLIVEAAGEGADEVRVNLASYTLAAGASVETLTGLSSAGQTLTGSSSANTLHGGSGADVLSGGGGTDILNGNGGNDTLRVTTPGQVHANGGSGTNVLVVDFSAATSALSVQYIGQSTYGATGGFGDYVNYQVNYTDIARFDITGGSAGDVLYAGDSFDTLSGGAGDDRLYGRGGNDVLNGGDGRDEIDGGLGSDVMSGGAGDDLYEVDSLSDTVVEAEGGGRDVIRTGLSSYTLQGQVEDLASTNAAGAILRGSVLGNAIYSSGGADLIRLEDGGADNGHGGGGDDIFFFGARFGDDKVDGGDGLDTIVLQGSYGPTAISGLDVKGVETFLLLGRDDVRFNSSGSSLNHYNLALSGGFHVEFDQPRLRRQRPRSQ